MSELSAAFAQKSRIAEWTLGIFCCVMAVYNLFFSTPYYVFLSMLGLVLVFVPRIAEWVLRLQKDYLLRLTSYLYLFLVYGIGMIFNGYDRIPLYDKVMHTLTGVVFGLCGLIAFYFLKPKQDGKIVVCKEEFWQAAVFSAGIAAIIAIGWEIVEFVLDLILHNDPQHVLDTGVNDTMMDMIVCMVGALLFWLPMHSYYAKGKRGLLMGIFESFCHTNSAEEK